MKEAYTECARAPSVLRLDHVCKSFGDTRAVVDVSFSVALPHIAALAGGNGSGKSTLLKMIAGVSIPDSGSVILDGAALEPGGVRHARSRGIEMVFQDCALCLDASVLENLFLGREPLTRLGFLHSREMHKTAIDLISRYQLPLPDLHATTCKLSGGQKKAVAIGRALLSHASFLLLDEPTAALGVKEQAVLLNTVVQLKRDGVGVILCTHSPDEILSVADRVLVLQRGCLIADRPIASLSRENLAVLMST